MKDGVSDIQYDKETSYEAESEVSLFLCGQVFILKKTNATYIENHEEIVSALWEGESVLWAQVNGSVSVDPALCTFGL